MPDYDKPWAAKMKKVEQKEKAPEPPKKSQEELDKKADDARKSANKRLAD